ncbi:TM1812 family CRISPR-associated protein [Veillonella sp. CHU594]|uniref:TM1812 family CRISPR-associated protein n=1 Tax=Veillonella sp. CHU594 TaxID=2490948 RepID=UPI000F8CE730|nr:TM1812 family CRISPR-associated protein [Veillonella sp. CHU594]
MVEKQDCNILLTAYSSIYGSLTSLESLDHNLEDLKSPMYEDDSECSFMDKALSTSETVLKYLLLPKKDGRGAMLNDLDHVFTFTTDDVIKVELDESENEKLKTYKLKDGTLVYQYLDGVKRTEFKNHKEFIDARMQTIYRYAMKDKSSCTKLTINDIHIKDETKGIESNVQNIFNMINNIIGYIEEIKKDPNKNVHVYVDITGGFRTIPVYLLFVLNVLEKRGIDVEKILYAQMNRDENTIKIDDLTHMINTQNFINGIHEFIEFGSAQELRKYFDCALKFSLENNYEPKYRAVTDAIVESVEAFAEAITISNQNEFQVAVEQIKKAWEALDDVEIEDIQDPRNGEVIELGRYIENRNLRLLKVFLPKIKKEYELIWHPKIRLDYIKWCLDHNFIQQALTLYVEIVPDILFDTVNTRGILGFIRKKKRAIHRKTFSKVKRKNKELKLGNKLSEIFYESTKDELRKKHKAGKSEYKLLYWLLNQYTGNTDDTRKKLALTEVHKDKQLCKEALTNYSLRVPDKWEKNPDIQIDNENVDIFFENIKIVFKKELQGQNVNINFDSKHITWKLSVLKEEEFKRNWKWIIQLFSNSKELRNLCVDTLDTLMDIIRQNECELKKSKDIKVVDELSKIIREAPVYQITRNEESKKIVSKMELLFGYLYLKKKIKEKITEKIEEQLKNELGKKSTGESTYYKTLKDINEALNRIDSVDLLQKSIEDIKEYLLALTSGNLFKIRKEYLKDSGFGGDEIYEVILPRTINGAVIEGAPKFSNMITSLDKYAKVDDIESLIAKGSLQVNQDVIEAFIGNKEEFKYDSERILQLIESINGSTRDDAEDIADKFLQLIPQDIGGKAESLDIWGRETLILLILRTLLYPYNTLKLIRNDSVHAREKRNIDITRKDIKILIERSILTIEKYLNAIKENNDDVQMTT